MLFLDHYEKLEDTKILLIPILQDSKKHYTQTQISFIYIFGLETYQEQVLNLTHNDCLRREISILNDFLGKDVYCYRKKYLSDCGANLKVLEAELVYWFETNKRLEVDVPFQIRQYWSMDIDNVNDCVPIMKWIEYCREIKDRFLVKFKKFELSEPFLKYNELLTNLEKIERNGLFIKSI